MEIGGLGGRDISRTEVIGHKLPLQHAVAAAPPPFVSVLHLDLGKQKVKTWMVLSKLPIIKSCCGIYLLNSVCKQRLAQLPSSSSAARRQGKSFNLALSIRKVSFLN